MRSLQASAASEIVRMMRADGWTQTALANASDTPRKHINEVLNGKSGVSPERLDRWASAMGCTWEVRLRKVNPVANR